MFPNKYRVYSYQRIHITRSNRLYCVSIISIRLGLKPSAGSWCDRGRLSVHMHGILRLEESLSTLPLDPNTSDHFSHIFKYVPMTPQIWTLSSPEFKLDHCVANPASNGTIVR